MGALAMQSETPIEWALREAREARTRIENLKTQREKATGHERARLAREIQGWLRFAMHCDRYVERHAASSVPEIRNAIRKSLGLPPLEK